MSQVPEIIGAIADLVESIDGLVQTDSFRELINLVKELGLEKVAAPVLKVICDVLTRVVGWLGTLERIAALPRITEPLMLSLGDIAALTDMTPPGKKEELEDLGWGELIPISEAANLAASLFTRLGKVGSALTSGELLEQKVHLLGKSMRGLLQTFDDYRKKLAPPATPSLPAAGAVT